MSRLFLPLLANQFDVLELLWQEIHRYGPRRDRFSAANRQNRTNPIEIPWRNSCKIATAAKSDTPGCRNLLGSCQYEFRALDLSTTSGTHDLNPSIKRKPCGFMQSCLFLVLSYLQCILVYLLQYLKDTINIILQTTTKYAVLCENMVTQI